MSPEALARKLQRLGGDPEAPPREEGAGAVPNSCWNAFRKTSEHGILPGELAGRLQEAAGLRNTLVHMCEEIDDGVVAASISRALEDFGRVLQVFEERLAAMEE